MKNVIPYSKEIIFKSNIGEISSISLEHEEEVVGNSIEGIFKVSGEYKTHEISINREDFSYDLPFSIELDEDIIASTVVVDIEDFNYTFSKDVLKVNIEFSVTGERKKEEAKEEKGEEIKEEVAEEGEDSNSKDEGTRNEVIFDEAIIDKINEITKNEQEAEMKKEEAKEEIKQTTEIKEETDVKESIEEKIDATKSSEEQEYITYHVHIIKEEENVESICKIYEVSQELVGEYNDLANIKTGDKLIIPEVKDE